MGEDDVKGEVVLTPTGLISFFFFEKAMSSE